MMCEYNAKTIVEHLLGINFPNGLPIAFLSQGTKDNATKMISNKIYAHLHQ